MEGNEYFDGVAQRWDEMREGFFSEAVRIKALAAIAPQPGQIAADIGAGSGFITEGLLELKLEVIAVDRSQRMLEVMRHKFHAAPRLDLRLAESDRLPIDDGAVDFVLANMYLHHVDSPLLAILEMARILKPQGKMVITDLDEHDFTFLRMEHCDRWMGFKREDIQKWLAEAGLEDVSIGCVGESCRAKSECGKECASVSIFMASGRK